jgi:Tfp pilus assembly protein PilF
LTRKKGALMRKILLACAVLLPFAVLAAPSGGSRSAAPAVPPEISAFESGTRHLLNMNLRQAERDLRRALNAREDFAEAHNNLAFVLRKQGEEKFEEALSHYQRALALNPDLAEAHMYLGVLHVQMGDKEAALAVHARLLELDADLAAELEWVITNGEEKDPEHFFGVVRSL